MVSRVIYRSVGEIRDIWESLLDSHIYPSCHEDDRETQGMAFLSFTALTCFRRVREKQKLLEAEVESLQQQLQVKKVEITSLQEKQQLAELKCQQLTIDLNSCQTQKCKSCAKYESEVVSLKSCMKLIATNISKYAADPSVNALEGNEHQKQMFTYMTQVLQGSQCDGITPSAMFTPAKKRPTEPVTPEEIQDTPEAPKRSRLADRLKRRALKDKLHLKKPMNLEPSSVKPLEASKAAGDQDAVSVQPKKITLLASSPIKQLGEQSFLVKNTEDLDGSLKERTVLRENVILESLNPESAVSNEQASNSAKSGKENRKSSDNLKDEKRLINLSTDVSFPSTPEKPIPTTKEGSPILGSAGSKKSISKRMGQIHSPEGSSPSLLGDSRSSSLNPAVARSAREVSLVGVSKISSEVHMEKHGRNRKRYIQTTIANSFKPRTTDLATLMEFNGGQRSASDLENLEVLKMSEADQIDFAKMESLKASRLSVSSHDSTHFEAPKWKLDPHEDGGVEDDEDFILGSPTSTSLNVRKGKPSKTSGCTAKRTALQDAPSVDETFFDPQLVRSQARRIGSKPPGTKGSMEIQFNPICASTMVTGDVEQIVTKQNSTEVQFNPPHASTAHAETEFNPQFASTSRELTQNSQLLALVQEMEKSNVAPTGLQTSYDRLPRKNPPSPDYVYKRDAVRKKIERQQLPGWECPDCAVLYDADGLAKDDPRRKNALDKCSRHRDKFGIGPLTPKGFWDPGFPSTQSLIGDISSHLE